MNADEKTYHVVRLSCRSLHCYQFIQIAHSIIVHNVFPILETGRGMAGHNWVSAFHDDNAGLG